MSHDLSPDVARKVAERAFAAYGERYAKYEPSLTWTSDERAIASFNARGLRLEGVIELGAGTISFDFKVPFLLRVFQKQAVGVMERELSYWVAKAKAGEI